MVMRAFLIVTLLAASIGAPAPVAEHIRTVETFWPNGVRRSAAEYLGDFHHGEYRTWRQDGSVYELRHYDHGRESGLQQSWSADGSLYLNYEVRHGRRYGFINSMPCQPAAADGTSGRAGQ